MRNKQRLLIMFLLIVMLFLYIVNNGHGLLYNHVISFVAALIVLILSIPKAVDTFAKQSKIVKSISFISKVLVSMDIHLWIVSLTIGILIKNTIRFQGNMADD